MRKTAWFVYYGLLIADILAMSLNCVYAAQITEQSYQDSICDLVYPKIEIAENRPAADKINSVIQGYVDKAKRAVQSADAALRKLSYITQLSQSESGRYALI